MSLSSALLLLALSALPAALTESCRAILNATVPGNNSLWVDADSTGADCTRSICRLGYLDCLGSKGFPKPFGVQATLPRTDDMVRALGMRMRRRAKLLRWARAFVACNVA